MSQVADAHNTKVRLVAYTLGFALSVALTLTAYILVADRILSGAWLLAAILGLAVLQLFAQLYFFLHLGREAKPKWNLFTFAFMLIVLGIVVFGSLWIMDHLNYNMTHPGVEEEIIRDEGIYR